MVNLDGIQWLPFIGVALFAFPLVALGYFLPHAAWLTGVLVVGASIGGAMILLILAALLINYFS